MVQFYTPNTIRVINVYIRDKICISFTIKMNFTNFTLESTACIDGAVYDLVCLQKEICPQLSSWFNRTAIGLIVLYVSFSWFIDLILPKLVKKKDLPSITIYLQQKVLFFYVAFIIILWWIYR